MQKELNEPTRPDLERIFQLKYGKPADLYWGPALRWKFRYFNPDDWYESLVDSLVTDTTNWLDVGSGRDVFPSNRELASILSQRCESIVGVDPDPTILENPFLHEKHQSTIEAFEHDRKFDLVTLRMVAEHIDDPAATISTIERCTAPGGLVVIYTVNKFSPVPLITRVTPFWLRHSIKGFLWGTEEKDTFPTRFRLNSRKDIARHASASGLQEALFLKLSDCRSFARWKFTLRTELVVWRFLQIFGLTYPENCLLGVYRKSR